MLERGRIKYVPKIALIELDDIKREDGISMDCEAFRKLVGYARIGRETKRFINFGYDWSKKKPLPPIEQPRKKNKKPLFGGFNF